MPKLISPIPRQQFIDANGDPLVGGLLYTYSAGTTTPADTFTDSSGSVPNTNPIVLDARGEASVWLSAIPYKWVLKTAAGVTVWTQDNLTAVTDNDTEQLEAESFVIACSDETTALTAGTAKVTFRMPFGMTLTEVRASLTTAQTSGNILTVDVNMNGVSLLSAKITVYNGVKSSVLSPIQPTISTATLTNDSSITIDLDQIGDGTAKGLKVILNGYRVSSLVPTNMVLNPPVALVRRRDSKRRTLSRLKPLWY